VDETSGTNPTDASAERGPDEGQSAESRSVEQPGFRSRGQARRRARFLRRARELAYRDLGGLVYNLHRFGQRNDPLVLSKLATLSMIDGELRTIEAALKERRPITVLREAGITACPRCAAIHGSEDRFCPNCGLPMSRHADLPIAGAPAAGAAGGDGTGGSQTGPSAPQPAAAAAPAQAPATFASAAPPAAPSAAANVGAPPAAGAPAAPSRPAEPATAQHGATAPPSVPAGVSGRSPSPPARAGAHGEPPAEGGRGQGAEEPTEIIRPPAPGS
jgi:hypothetical protein